MAHVTPMNSMADVLASKAEAGEFKKGKKSSMPNIEVSAWVSERSEVDKKALREEEKHLQREAKMIRDVLNQWDGSVIATKARKKFESQLEDMNERLKKIRKRLG